MGKATPISATSRPRKQRQRQTKPHPWSDSVAFLLRNSYRVFARALQERIQAEGIPIGSWPFLRHLWQEDGITQRELTNAVGLMQPNTNVALKQLTRRGWVKQSRDHDDKRKIRIHLTPKGRELFFRAFPLALQAREQALADFSEHEIATLRSLLKRITKNLDSVTAGEE
jgi:MarR family transcriptional regulator, organic hydroperoxide resistance regulator